MKQQNIKSLIWDKINFEHIKKHNLSIYEVEQALKDKNRKVFKVKKERYMVLCKYKNRMLSIIVAMEQKRTYYLVTARDMDKNERNKYRGENT
ncbi:hypothetical protein A3F07_04435 [candidate division WWE3 bacterium RIFCSPHIGHO2_12_FULL_38_15]|uniref:Toxin n=1 Tax=candidate division WWE3 bacterium RIFCSPHIGHO2_02_FULL_38_14 TaxID=1802620 RepID=A0A1F4V6V2_UNCKA|nr:MAG: hypothetical protein A2793_01225 [candidate division WWE3 bacterium RIFCSPHIGHO2_01_FULL_38_45]OGC48999.1 MAG: hypothetical protein A3F07_04435 [candidate division WWE3 bacterium RIFCSPHIGHO2_12_FULL_38_15]OGC52897.1 MAG: hypothetical protein A3D91_03445 [candidate division WWE3 bacterium RIFCSPHIGHO2_02_FULL_38_14]OGC54610.1 MAG: hypothetical protein A3B64_03050 [candidate division WWE3 bacterium RIFCSPLOWO2_01_FULL_37_24]HLB51351.1 BrnT family toxin [Patescibacteria group bacterium]